MVEEGATWCHRVAVGQPCFLVQTVFRLYVPFSRNVCVTGRQQTDGRQTSQPCAKGTTVSTVGQQCLENRLDLQLLCGRSS